MNTVSGGLPDGAVAGASAGRCAEIATATSAQRQIVANSTRFFMRGIIMETCFIFTTHVISAKNVAGSFMTSRVLAVGLLAGVLNGCASSQSATPAPQPPPAPPAASRAATPLRQQWLDMFARGYFPGRSGQVFVVPKQGRFVTSHDPLYTFMHGSPWEYDTHIPLLLYGAPFVKAANSAHPQSSRTSRRRSAQSSAPLRCRPIRGAR